MDMDFFNAQPQSEYQSGRGFEPPQQDAQDHQDGDFNDFHGSDAQPNVDVHAANVAQPYPELNAGLSSHEPDDLEVVRKQEELLHQKLQ